MGGITPVDRRLHNNHLEDQLLEDFKHRDQLLEQPLPEDQQQVDFKHRDQR